MNKTTEALKLAEEAFDSLMIEQGSIYQKALAAIREVLAEPVKQELEFAGWYCAHCERGVDASEVTFHEQHEVCGRVITNDVPPKPVKQEPVLRVGDSSFEEWYQAHPKACGGDKQLARDAYAAGMGDPLVAPVQPEKQEPVVDYAYSTIQEYEEFAGFSVSQAFKTGWCMARTTNSMLGIKAEPVKPSQLADASLEPVAWVNNESVQKLRECGWSNEAIETVVPTINLGAPVDAKAIRAEALEEAAKVADRHSTCLNDTPNVIAAAIRGMK